MPLISAARTIQVLAQQGGSEIRATVCDSQGPAIQINSPVSDSVTNNPTLNISGTAIRTTQIDFFLNNAYSNSLPIGSDGLFQTTLTLPEGTNTIRLDAYFSCNQTQASTSLVVDYQPIEYPSTGGTVDTTVKNVDSNKNVVSTSNSALLAEQSITSRIKNKLTFNKPKKALQAEPNENNNASFVNSYVRPASNWLLLIGAFVALILSFISIAIASSIAQASGLISQNKKLKITKLMRIIFFVVAVLFSLILAG